MRRIRLKVAYDGTDYCGFQAQPEVPTIEGKLNLAISALTGEDISVIGASRTDSGVMLLEMWLYLTLLRPFRQTGSCMRCFHSFLRI